MPNDPRSITPPDDGLQYLSSAMAAALVNRRPKTLERHAREGKVPAVKDLISGHWLFRPEDVLRAYVPQHGLIGNTTAAIDAVLRKRA